MVARRTANGELQVVGIGEGIGGEQVLMLVLDRRRNGNLGNARREPEKACEISATVRSISGSSGSSDGCIVDGISIDSRQLPFCIRSRSSSSI